MLSLILTFGFANVIGGRSKDIFGEDAFPIRATCVFRCIIPALAAAAFAFEKSGSISLFLCALFAVGAGSALWFPWGWSFDEINGTYDTEKYPSWVQKIGLWVFPLVDESTNKKRGVLMKGIRGAFDIATFALLAPFNPWVMLLWLPTFSMGLVYWLCGKIFAQSPVSWAEFFYGCLRGALIGTAIILVYNSN